MADGISLRLLLCSAAILVLLLAVSWIVPGYLQTPVSSTLQDNGSLIVTVLDGFTEQPLQDASVVIPETGQQTQTNAQGKTEPMQVPILADTSYQNILPKTWGEITLLVYYPGYLDCAIFHVNITKGKTRQGPTVLLFPQDAGATDQPFALIESPNRQWVQELLRKYCPSDN